MTPERKQQRADSDAWKNWKYWNTRKKLGAIGVLLVALAWYVFWNHTLPKLLDNEVKAESAAAKSAAATSASKLQIPKPDVPIPPNPSTRP